jgi:hypothetical protein
MILPRHRKDWDAKWLQIFEERAGILEFCANLPRLRAEIEAEQDIRRIAKGESCEP